jgi:hypothetical protein
LIQLGIAYTPDFAFAAGKISEQLRNKLGDVTVAYSVSQPVDERRILYFFVQDRRKALHIEEQLAHLIHAHTLVALAHVKQPPPIGTLEIRFPSNARKCS